MFGRRRNWLKTGGNASGDRGSPDAVAAELVST